MGERKTVQDVHAYIERVAERFGWQVNNRGEMLDALVEGLMENYNRLGYYNCPCRDSQQDPKIDRYVICPH